MTQMQVIHNQYELSPHPPQATATPLEQPHSLSGTYFESTWEPTNRKKAYNEYNPFLINYTTWQQKSIQNPK